MEKKDLIDLLKKILNTDVDLNFLLKLDPKEIELLIACMRDRIEKERL